MIGDGGREREGERERERKPPRHYNHFRGKKKTIGPPLSLIFTQ
jgi:hypothetical protein